jgi:hypothetical protein
MPTICVLCNVLNNNADFKIMNFFLSKKYSHKKLISRHNDQPNTLTRQEHKGKIYVKNIRKNSCRIRNQLKSTIRILIRKISFRIHNTAVLEKIDGSLLKAALEIQSLPRTPLPPNPPPLFQYLMAKSL